MIPSYHLDIDIISPIFDKLVEWSSDYRIAYHQNLYGHGNTRHCEVSITCKLIIREGDPTHDYGSAELYILRDEGTINVFSSYKMLDRKFSLADINYEENVLNYLKAVLTTYGVQVN